jgi:hypothetical protein
VKSEKLKSVEVRRTQSRRDAIWVARRFNAGYGMMLSSPERRSPEIFYSMAGYGLIRAACTKRGRGFAAPGFAVDDHPALKHRATHIPPRRGGVRRPVRDGMLVERKSIPPSGSCVPSGTRCETQSHSVPCGTVTNGGGGTYFYQHSVPDGTGRSPDIRRPQSRRDDTLLTGCFSFRTKN